jgi:hypothetical protein
MNRAPTLSWEPCPSCGCRAWYMYVVTEHETDSVPRSVPIVDWIANDLPRQTGVLDSIDECANCHIVVS